jgi:hypothetical protein
MSTALRKVIKILQCHGMTCTAVGYSSPAIAFINNLFHHLSDCREGHECREKDPDDQVMKRMFGYQYHGIFSGIE